MGDNTIHYRGHVRMMGAVQPFISGAISKTVNMPEEATVEDVEQLHIEAWELGLKAVAIYRDNCKVAQPLATAKRTVADPAVSEAEAHDAELALKVAELEQALSKQTTVVVKQPIRERMPRRRRSTTFAFRVADCEGFVTVGEYEDGRPGEVFMKVAKQGSTLAGIMDAFAISVSLGLQHGVPLSTYVKKYTVDALRARRHDRRPGAAHRPVAGRLHLPPPGRRLHGPTPSALELGVLTSAERTQPTLPGVDEAVTPNQSIVDDRLDLDGHTGPSTRDEGVTSAVGPVTGGGAGGATGGVGRARSRRRPLLLPVRGADAAGRELPRLPVVRDHQRLLVTSGDIAYRRLTPGRLKVSRWNPSARGKAVTSSQPSAPRSTRMVSISACAPALIGDHKSTA